MSFVLIILGIQHNETFLAVKKTILYKINGTMSVCRGLDNLYNYTFNAFVKHYDVVQEKDRLLQTNILLQNKLDSLNSVVEENIQLKKLLNVTQDFPIAKITMKIINRKWEAAGPVLFGFTENAMSIPADCLVITEDGLLGKTDGSVGKVVAIIPISNKNFRIPVVLRQSSERAIMVGGDKPKLTYLEENAEIHQNEGVVTSVDSSAPTAVPIGTVRIKNSHYFVAPNTISMKKYKFATILVPGIS